MDRGKVIVVGAGIGGLAAALDLAAGGAQVTVLERAAHTGGKLRKIAVGGRLIDAGPTVFTMPAVFEELFARAGTTLADELPLRRATTLARHAWPGGASLDLFADLERSCDAIGRFSGARDAEGYRRFAADAKRIHETLEGPFMRSDRPSLPVLIKRVASVNPANLWCIQPYASLWRKLGGYFRDARLRQLFARYATYNGSSPFHAPATLMLIAHVEREGVWLIEGGMQKLADALTALVRRQGAEIRCAAPVSEILVRQGRAEGVRLASGEAIHADAVICNADVNAIATGAFGEGVRRAAEPVAPPLRSLSAMTWAMLAAPSGFPLLRHTVFFSSDYPAEFDDILKRQRLPAAPTVYVCAQDRGDGDAGIAADQAPERLLCVVNAPATGDTNRFDEGEVKQCSDSMVASLARCGLRIRTDPRMVAVTTPADFHRAYPATGGAIYGRASHGWMASFQRAPARSRIPGLYFAGGSSHPGAGLPMAALSGRLAAQALRTDLALQKRFRPAAMRGGMSTA
jgi:1-hydroxycarotenoid 3,4-desaturase